MKHILNNLTDKEKQAILEQHKGGMKVMTESFSKLIKATLGDAKPLVSEQADDQNTHRYDKGEQSPGIEKFLSNPSDEKISTGLLNQLRNDPFGKGKIVIIFNGEKFKEPGSFLFKIQSDSKAGKCYEITNYDYNNRIVLNTQIKITANGVECKKTTKPIKTSGGTTPIKISGGTGNTILIQSVGYQRGSFFVFKQVYDAAGLPIDGLFADLNRDGSINEKDLYQYKGNNPEFFFGASSSLTYKKWNAGFVLSANIGNYMYNNVASSSGTLRNFLNPIGYINNGSRDYLKTGFSGDGSNYFLSDYYVQNASFLRMDNINIGYNVGKLFNNKANLRINANVQNAFIITKYKGLDPEVNGGIDNNFYPRPRTFVLGLNLNF